MENSEQWIFECNVEIKSEPDDNNEEFSEIIKFNGNGSEPSTSNAVHTDKSVLPCDSYNHKIEREELEIPPEQNYDENDNCCSESDQVALESKSDDQKLLEGIYILETQRIQAIKDLNELFELQEQALFDPDGFLENLQKHNFSFSASAKIHELPVTDWSKYELNFSADRVKGQQTKLAAKITDLISSAPVDTVDPFTVINKEEERRFQKGYHLCQKGAPKRCRHKVWTAEEQKKLEELLVRFPPEAVETHRWKKIAECLEDRTHTQVQARVKRYFKILKQHEIPAKQGTPTFDRVKKLCSCFTDPNTSTLLVSHQPPEYSPEGSEGKSNFLFPHKRKRLVQGNFKYWTEEEQKKLDELLIKYPAEEDEHSRCEKISKHFQKRTASQIAARVKYLKWLMQRGKFVPGKIPGIQFNEVSSADTPRYSHGSNIMQYWSPEEQAKLEELLIRFPPERFELQRWRKIANCLGNRTPWQVGSRAKVYFKMCQRYGMPVRGRVPRPYSKIGRKRVCTTFEEVDVSSTILDSHQSTSTVENSMESEKDGFVSNQPPVSMADDEHSYSCSQPPSAEENSTEYKMDASFSHHLPIYMPDDEDGYSCSQPPRTEENSVEYQVDASVEEDIKPQLRNLPEYQEFRLLEETLKERQRSGESVHFGYKCCRCQAEPIRGTRWHCAECRTQSVDFCSDCCDSEYEFDQHTSNHQLEAVVYLKTQGGPLFLKL